MNITGVRVWNQALAAKFKATRQHLRFAVASGFRASVGSSDDSATSDVGSQQLKHRVRLAEGGQRKGAREVAKVARAKRSKGRSPVVRPLRDICAPAARALSWRCLVERIFSV